MARPNREVDRARPLRRRDDDPGAGVHQRRHASTRSSRPRRRGCRPEVAKDPAAWVDAIYQHALARKPTDAEKQVALEMLGKPVKPEGVADFLWALTMLPEFQLIN